ncbi:MAG: response regulator [Cytophagaceae bacterium]|nr:MAG: response regulator [Cytophagaceae bacterium]
MPKFSFLNANILIVDDEPVNVLLLERILKKAGYSHIRSTTIPEQVLPLCAEEEPDLILLDLMMPNMSGFDVMEQLSSLIPEETFLPILILTADATAEAKRKALFSEATDYLHKPFDHTEVLLRIRNLLAIRKLHCTLEERVQERTSQLAQSQVEILERLAQAGEFRDDDTGRHTQRVAHTAALLAQALGLPAHHVRLISQAAPLHDVGKIAVSDLILLKPGTLTDEEFCIMKTHAAAGAALLADGQSEVVEMAEGIARSHHERWDGKGYPLQLKGEQIPLEGRILAVADVFDALTHERPYKKAWQITEAVAEIKSQSGQQFDPQVVEAFMTLQHEELV